MGTSTKNGFIRSRTVSDQGKSSVTLKVYFNSPGKLEKVLVTHMSFLRAKRGHYERYSGVDHENKYVRVVYSYI